jgi:tetratricopeptide (TPR) repeat protein
VAIAIKHNRIIQTILTEPENQVSAPLTLSSIQWHKFSDWKDIKEGKKTGPKGEDWDAWFGSLMSGIRQNLADITYQKAVGELSELKEIFKPTSFDAAIINSVEGFFGRQWLFDATNEWFKTDNRLFWLKGTPGIGKSSFAAKLVHSGNSSIVGFFKCDFQGLKSAEESASECIRTLAYQLASRLPDYRIKLLRGQQVDAETVQKKTADDLFTYLITEPLNRSEKIAEAGRLALVIDALDEAGRLVNGKMANPLADLLYKHADQLPPWLGVIVTSRPEAYLQQQLGAKFSPLIMEGGSQNNLSDIKDYLETKLDSGITGAQRDRTITAIIDKSGGTFLYVKRVESSYDLSKPETLPNGLDDLFYKDFERYFPDPKVYEEKTEKFLSVLAAAPGPLPKQLAQELLQWQARDITQYVTQPMTSLLTETEEGLQFFHKSIKDWLQEGTRSGIYQVNDSGAKELGNFLWNEFEKGQPKEEVKEGTGEKETAETKEKPKRIPGIWEKQIIEWLAPLLPNIEQWQERDALNTFADYLHKSLRYQDELTVRRQHLKLAKEEFGDLAEEVAASMTGLGDMLITLGDFREVEDLFTCVLKIRQKEFGSEHPSTAISLNNLGRLFSILGEPEKAKPFFINSLHINEKVFGPENLITAQSLNCVGIVLKDLGQYDESESMYRKALEIREKLLDQNHFDTSGSLNNLGILLSNMGRYDEAQSLYRRAIAIREEVLGLEHPETSMALNNLGVALKHLDSLDESEILFRRAIEINEKVFGLIHPSIAMFASNLGDLLSQNEHYEEAEACYKKAFEIREKLFGCDHPFTSSTHNDLGILYAITGQYDKAEFSFRKALEGREKILGGDHPDTENSLHNLTFTLRDMAKYEEATNLLIRLHEVKRKRLGSGHPDILELQSFLGENLIELSRYEEAEPFYREILEIQKENLGPDNSELEDYLYPLYLICRELGKYDEALFLGLKLIDITKNKEGEHGYNLIDLYRCHGVFLRDIGRFTEAEKFLEKAVFLFKKYKKTQWRISYDLAALGKLRILQQRYQEAESLLMQCQEMDNSIGDGEFIRGSRKYLYELYENWGKPEEAAKYQN